MQGDGVHPVLWLGRAFLQIDDTGEDLGDDTAAVRNGGWANRHYGYQKAAHAWTEG